MGSFYRSQHELIFVFKNGDAPHINNFELGQHGRNRSNVWAYAGVNTFRTGRLDDLGAHPTVKPVAMVADAMRTARGAATLCSTPSWASGTTILAAERVGRRAYGLELDPAMSMSLSGVGRPSQSAMPVLAATGETFDEWSPLAPPNPRGG